MDMFGVTGARERKPGVKIKERNTYCVVEQGRTKHVVLPVITGTRITRDMRVVKLVNERIIRRVNENTIKKLHFTTSNKLTKKNKS